MRLWLPQLTCMGRVKIGGSLGSTDGAIKCLAVVRLTDQVMVAWHVPIASSEASIRCVRDTVPPKVAASSAERS